MSRSDELQDVMEQLETLAPTAADAPRPPAQALARLQREIEREERVPHKWRITNMLQRKYALAGLVAVLVLVIAFSLAPVRAAASDFLGLFRVQKFAAVSVSPQQMALLEQIAEEGLHPGELTMVEEPAEPQPVASLAEATAKAGFDVRSLPDLGAPDAIQVSGGGSGELTVDLATARRILEMAEVDPKLLPDSLDGAAIAVDVYPAVYQQWGDVMFVQTASPEVDYPDDVDPRLLGQALLQFVGMAPSEARRLADNIDWTSTLLLPVPQDVATFSEVTVDGNSGLALSSIEGQGSSLIWQAGGIVHMLVSDGSVDDLSALANSLQ